MVFFEILAFFAAIVFGILAVMVGIGGGLMYVPFLIFILNKGDIATITSTFIIIFTSLVASYRYRKQNILDVRTGLIFVAFAIPGTVLGAFMAETVFDDVSLVKRIFAVLVGITAIRNIIKIYTQKTGDTHVTPLTDDFKETGFEQARVLETSNGQVFSYVAHVRFGAIFASIGGFLAGFLGIGGGIIYVPVLTAIGGLPVHVAAPTSAFMIFFVSLIALNIRLTQFDGDPTQVFYWGAIMAAGAVIGAIIGAAKARRIQSKNILLLFWSIAILAAIRMGL